MDKSASDAVLARLMRLHPKEIDLSLGRLNRLLAKLSHPEKRLPPVVHISGTNGKGSTTATLRAFAEAAGYRVHVYTSPHLVYFNERIRVAGKLIEEEALLAILEECETANGDDPITFFEITTAAALLAFSRTPADLCILEVGLGGLYDATNVIDMPAAVGITPVSMDHQQFLGDSLVGIAAEKAGIIKNGAPSVVAPQQDDALKRITEVAYDKGVTPLTYGHKWKVTPMPARGVFLYEDWQCAMELPMPILPGEHQCINAGTAIAIAHAQQAISIPNAAIKAGLGWVRWPGRLQELKGTSLNALLPEGADLWLDGGHNPDAARVVRDFLKQVDPVERSVSLVLGMLGTKDAEGYLKNLGGVIDRVIAVPIEGQENMTSPAFLAGAATDAGISGIIAKDVPSALEMVAERAHPDRPPYVLIAGSLYLAGNVLRETGLIPT